MERHTIEDRKLIGQIIDNMLLQGCFNSSGLKGKLEWILRGIESIQNGSLSLRHHDVLVDSSGHFWIYGQKPTLPPYLAVKLSNCLMSVITSSSYRLGDDYIVLQKRAGAFYVQQSNVDSIIRKIQGPPTPEPPVEMAPPGLYPELHAFAELRKKIIELRNRIHESPVAYDHGLRLLGDLLEHDAQRLFERLNSKSTQAQNTDPRKEDS